MKNGFYGMYYTGPIGTGFGLIVLLNGHIVGVDVGGGEYDGTFDLDETSLKGHLLLRLPAGVPLVTTGQIQDQVQTVEIPFKIPTTFASGEPIRIQTPTGPINVIFRFLREIDKEAFTQ